MVELSKMNTVPKCGVYNGALGTVIDVIFEKGKSKQWRPSFCCSCRLQTLPMTHLGYTTFNTCINRSNTQYVRTKLLYLKINTFTYIMGKKIHYVQGHNAGPTAATQTPNAIQRIVIHLGDRTYEALNPGLTYVAISRATTIGCLGHMTEVPKKCMNSVIYFLGGTFLSNIKCLTHLFHQKRIYQGKKAYSLGFSFWIKRRRKQTIFQTPMSEME
jgi:hypothetical protein